MYFNLLFICRVLASIDGNEAKTELVKALVKSAKVFSFSKSADVQ